MIVSSTRNKQSIQIGKSTEKARRAFRWVGNFKQRRAADAIGVVMNTEFTCKQQTDRDQDEDPTKSERTLRRAGNSQRMLSKYCRHKERTRQFKLIEQYCNPSKRQVRTISSNCEKDVCWQNPHRLRIMIDYCANKHTPFRLQKKNA